MDLYIFLFIFNILIIIIIITHTHTHTDSVGRSNCRRDPFVLSQCLSNVQFRDARKLFDDVDNDFNDTEDLYDDYDDGDDCDYCDYCYDQCLVIVIIVMFKAGPDPSGKLPTCFLLLFLHSRDCRLLLQMFCKEI